jgi:hypothetical protein
MIAYSVKLAGNGQGFARWEIRIAVCPKPSAEYRIKKFIICSFADRIPSA